MDYTASTYDGWVWSTLGYEITSLAQTILSLCTLREIVNKFHYTPKVFHKFELFSTDFFLALYSLLRSETDRRGLFCSQKEMFYNSHFNCSRKTYSSIQAFQNFYGLYCMLQKCIVFCTRSLLSLSDRGQEKYAESLGIDTWRASE